jgi:hypothetical protein
MPGHLDVIEIPSADPITVALGGNNDIVIAQLHDDGRRASVYFDVQHAKRNRRGDPHTGEALQWKMRLDVEVETLRYYLGAAVDNHPPRPTHQALESGKSLR